MLISNSHSSGSLFVFVDESGNLDFSESGTKHFVMASVMTTDPIASSTPIQQLKYDLISQGQDLSSFRASKNANWVRHEVLHSFSRLALNGVHVVHAIKKQLPSSLKIRNLMFREFALRTSTEALKVVKNHGLNQATIILDQTVSAGEQDIIRGMILSSNSDKGVKVSVLFHPVSTDFNGQIADYVAWAKFRQLERGDYGPWTLLSRTLKPTEQHIFGA